MTSYVWHYERVLRLPHSWLQLLLVFCIRVLTLAVSTSDLCLRPCRHVVSLKSSLMKPLRQATPLKLMPTQIVSMAESMLSCSSFGRMRKLPCSTASQLIAVQVALYSNPLRRLLLKAVKC